MKYISRESFLFYNKTNFERFTSLVTDKREDTAQCFRRVSGRVWTSSWSWRSRPCLRCWWRASPAVRTPVKERLQVRSSHPPLSSDRSVAGTAQLYCCSRTLKIEVLIILLITTTLYWPSTDPTLTGQTFHLSIQEFIKLTIL